MVDASPDFLEDHAADMEDSLLAESAASFDPHDLNERHIGFVAVTGMIGTGIFLACGKSLADAGPGGALVGYIVVSIMYLSSPFWRTGIAISLILTLTIRPDGPEHDRRLD
jgi:amino acid permease